MPAKVGHVTRDPQMYNDVDAASLQGPLLIRASIFFDEPQAFDTILAFVGDFEQRFNGRVPA